MIEMLFRGKPLGKLHGKFIYGSLGVIDTDLCAIYHYHCFEFKADEMQLVDIGTVGQYTGLKDKNGNKIFEGDIVERLWLGEKHIYRIYYDNDIASFIGKDIYGLNFTTFDYDACEFEVIGNIYDNPELLEVEE